MIGKIKTTPRADWAMKLPLWNGGQTHEFDAAKGLTVLFGGNGCGKTTLLQAIARACCIDSFSNVQKHVQPLRLSSNYNKSIFERCEEFRIFTNGLETDVDWPGVRVAWVGPETLNRKLVHTDQIFSRIGGDALWRETSRCSEGETTTITMRYIIEWIKQGVSITQSNSQNYNDVWKEAEGHWNTFVPDESDGRERRAVLLLDEVERSLSFQSQVSFFEQIRQLCDDHLVQVIAASHSLVSLAYADKVLEFEDSLTDKVIQLTEDIANKARRKLYPNYRDLALPESTE